MDTFTWVTGIASLISFGIQIFDLFPRYKEARHGVLFFSAGLFLGSLLNAVEPSSIKIQVHLTGFVLLISALTAILGGLLLVAAFTSDDGTLSAIQNKFPITQMNDLVFALCRHDKSRWRSVVKP